MADRRPTKEQLASLAILKTISHGRDLIEYVKNEIENSRDHLEDCPPEDLKKLQGEVAAYRRILKHVA